MVKKNEDNPVAPDSATETEPHDLPDAETAPTETASTARRGTQKSTAASAPRRRTPAKKAPVEDAAVEDADEADEPVEVVEQAESGAEDSAESTAETPGRADAPAPASPTTVLLFQAPPPLPPSTAGRPSLDEPDEGEAEDLRRRRRSRGRGGSGGAGSGAAGGDAGSGERTAEKPREAPLITEPQRLRGSTRLEAKKQRRRSGQDSGRRRSVVTEAEFLARRESVDRVMVVRSMQDRIQIGVLEDGVLVEHYVARAQESGLSGNVYLGKVRNVLPSMEAAFVDIGRGRNAVLYAGEVDWDAAAANATPEGEAPAKNQPRRIEVALKESDRVLVQVTKDPVGHKGARLTSQISLPGRFLVYVPNGSMSGISRKLPDTERARLKRILKEIVPDNAGVIVRTAAEGATEEQLALDVSRLTAQWERIQREVEKGNAPKLLHAEPDLLLKIVRDVFNEDFSKLIVSGDDALSTISEYLGSVAPDLMDRLERYEGSKDVFDEHRISEQIDKALERKAWLPSGGSLVIDRTEAMTVIDVNTGKFVGSGGNLEETVTRNNLEAAEEIVRQLRLRDIGGIIVIDFIDMVLETNRDLVQRRLIECLSRDRTKHQVTEVTSLGLVQMTRKKVGLGLLEAFSVPCEVCAGRGVIVHHEPVLKHRSGSPASGGDQPSGRGDGGSGSSRRRGRANSAPKTSSGSSGTHALTDDVRNALAQVAKGTVAAASTEETTTTAEAAEVAPDTAATTTGPNSATGTPPAEASAEAAADPVEQPIVLDLPAEQPARRRRRVSAAAAARLVEAALDPLAEAKSAAPAESDPAPAPEPKEAPAASTPVVDAPAAQTPPAAARARRSRRVTTASVVTPGEAPAG